MNNGKDEEIFRSIFFIKPEIIQVVVLVAFVVQLTGDPWLTLFCLNWLIFHQVRLSSATASEIPFNRFLFFLLSEFISA